MKNIFSKIKNFYQRVEDILVDYIGLEQQVAYNYAHISGKINQISNIPKKKFADEGLNELSNLASYVSDAISDFREKFNNFLGKFNPINNKTGGLENKIQNAYIKTNNQLPKTLIINNTELKNSPTFSNYSSAMNYLKNNSLDETKKVINILDGSNAWKWEKRAKLFINYMQSGEKKEIDTKSIKEALEKNSYLKRKHSEIYNTIIGSLK